MKFVLETLVWMVITGSVVIWIWGFNPASLGISLILSFALSLIGGNMLFNRENWI